MTEKKTLANVKNIIISIPLSSIMISQNNENVNIETNINEQKSEILSRTENHKNASVKLNNMIVAYLESINENEKAERVMNCASWIMIRNWKDPESTSKLNRANFCKHPLCIACQWRKSLKIAPVIEENMKKISEAGFNLYHLILTIENTKHINNNQLKQLKKQAKLFIKKELGTESYISSLEISFSKNEEFHPHIHAILASKRNIIKNEKNMINEISEMRWKWGNIVESKKGYAIMALYKIKKDNIEKSAREIAKYITKPPKTEIKQEQVNELAEAIKSIRKIEYAGIFRTNNPEIKTTMQNEIINELERLSEFEHEDEYFQFNEKTKKYIKERRKENE